MAHVAYCIHALHGKDMCLVIGKVGVGLDGCRDVFQLGTVFEFHIDHAAMDSLTEWNGHGKGVLHTGL